MKVILKQSVKKLGRKFDIVEVSDGYALNYLFPQELAERASERKIEAVQQRVKDATIRREEMLSNAESIASSIEGKQYTLAAKVSEKEHLYAAVHEKEIVELLEKEAKIHLDEDQIKLKKAIKELGVHSINVQLTPEIVCTFNIEVVAE